jgi:hypothetical protein
VEISSAFAKATADRLVKNFQGYHERRSEGDGLAVVVAASEG